MKILLKSWKGHEENPLNFEKKKHEKTFKFMSDLTKCM